MPFPTRLMWSTPGFYSIENIFAVSYSQSLVSLPYRVIADLAHSTAYLAALDCEVQDMPSSRVGIFLKLLVEKDQYIRVLVNGEDCRTFKSECAARGEYRKIYIRHKGWTLPRTMNALYGFRIRTLPAKIVTTARLGENRHFSEVTCFNI